MWSLSHWIPDFTFNFLRIKVYSNECVESALCSKYCQMCLTLLHHLNIKCCLLPAKNKLMKFHIWKSVKETEWARKVLQQIGKVEVEKKKKNKAVGDQIYGEVSQQQRGGCHCLQVVKHGGSGVKKHRSGCSLGGADPWGWQNYYDEDLTGNKYSNGKNGHKAASQTLLRAGVNCGVYGLRKLLTEGQAGTFLDFAAQWMFYLFFQKACTIFLTSKAAFF